MHKRLYRSSHDKMIGGVCGGIAEYFGIDPTIIRLLLVFIVLMSVVIPGIVFYLIAWAIMPQE